MSENFVYILIALNIITAAGLVRLYIVYRRQIKQIESTKDKNTEQEKALFLQSRYASMGEMIGNIIHQWREPLGAIGAIQTGVIARVMFGLELDKDAILESSKTSSKLLTHLSDTIETFYGFLKNKNDPESTFSVKSTLETIKKIMSYSLERDYISLTYAVTQDCNIQGRENEFSQALINIITNARDILIKRGITNRAIHIEVELLENTCLITLRDNGGGIDIEPIEKIFEPFVSAKGSSGIGLYITKTIITQRLGGNIAVENTPNGALFTLEIPYKSGELISTEKDFDKEITSVAKMMGKIVELENAEKDMHKWADIFQQTHWGIAIHKGMSNRFESVNPAFLKMYGYSAEDIEHIDAIDCALADTLPLVEQKHREALENGFASFVGVSKRKDGSTFDTRVNITVVKDKDGNALYHIANIYDITEEKQQKRLLDTIGFAINHVADAVFLITKDRRLQWVNNSACTSLGYKNEELLALTIADFDPDFNPDYWTESSWENFRQIKQYTIEARHKRKNGSMFPVEIAINYLEYDNTEYSLCVARDITERKLSEEALHNTINKLTQFASAFPGMLYTYHLDTNGNVAMPYTSDGLYELFGIDYHILEKNGNYLIENLIHPDDRDRMLSKVIESKDNLSLWNDEFRITHPTKGIRWIAGQSMPQVQNDGSIIWHGVLIDITDRKEAEKDLLIANKALNNSNEATYIMTNERFIQVNDGACRMLGYSHEEFAAMNLYDIDKDADPAIIEATNVAFTAHDSFRFERKHTTKDGRVLDVEIVANFFEYEGVLYSFSTARDITEQKAATERLLLKKFALDTINEAIFLIDKNSSFHYVNDGACKALGYTREELLTMGVVDIDPNCSTSWWGMHWEDIKIQKSVTGQSAHKRKDGTLMPIEVSSNYFEYNGMEYSLAVSRDITERLALEERTADERMRLFFERQLVGMAITSPEQGWLQTNKKLQEMLGYTHEELCTMTWAQLTHPDDLTASTGKLTLMLKGEIDDFMQEKRYIRKDGQVIYVNLAASCVRNDDNSVNYVLALLEDITERKAVEKALKIKELEFRSLTENIPDNVARWDTEGRYLYINPVHEKTLGISAAEIIGKSISDRYNEVNIAIAQACNTGESVLIRQSVPTKDGGVEYHDVNIVPEKDASGKIISVLGIGRDMTNIYRIQEEIAAREQELRALAESSPGMMGAFHMRPDGSVCMPYVSPNIFELFGVRPEDVRDDASPLLATNHPDDIDMVMQTIAESARTMSLWHIEYRIIHPTKGMRWMEGNTMPQLYPDGGIVWYGYVHDITERKQVEKELDDSHIFLNQIIDSIPDPIFVKDRKHKWKMLNSAFCSLSGLSKETLIGKSDYDVFPNEEADVFWAKDEMVFRSGEVNTNEESFTSANGDTHHIETVKATFSTNDNIQYLVGTIRDLSARKALENKLQLEHRFLVDAQRVAKTGSWYRDVKSGILTWSDETYRIFELDKDSVADLHKTFYECVHPDDRKMVEEPYIESLKTGEPYEIHHRIVMNDGRIKYVIERCEHIYADDGTPLYSIGTVQDVTDRVSDKKD